ncbi:MAG: thiamine phosphate synthase [Candidatus Omnitrophota bacterium]|nr:thiamine phosphate synthase [Candidatus Omnitrophota bacterium]
MLTIKDYSLYVVVSEEFGCGRNAFEIATAVIAGGADILQMREKAKSAGALEALGKVLAQLCKEKKVIFIVNDDPYLARRLDADGVHLGQEDMQRYSLRGIRDIIGTGKIIGVSTHSIEQFVDANMTDVDYIAYGPIFLTKTKEYSIGTADIATVVQCATKPVFFIGGIDLTNLDELLCYGAKNIALIRGILQAPDITLKTMEFKQKLLERS